MYLMILRIHKEDYPVYIYRKHFEKKHYSIGF